MQTQQRFCTYTKLVRARIRKARNHSSAHHACLEGKGGGRAVANEKKKLKDFTRMCAPCSVGNCFEGKALHVKDGYHGTHNSVQSGKLVSLCERRLTKDASLF